MKRIIGAIWLLLLAAIPAFATVSTETTRVAYTCNGVLTSYAYPFKVLADADLLVIKKATATSAETTLVLNTDYTVTGAGTSGGNVVLTAGSKCGSGYTLTILRNMSATQTTDYVDGEAFSAESLETAIDKATIVLQQQKEQIGRAPKLPKTSTITDIALPNPTASNYIGWNAAATGLENKSGPVITTATQYEIDALVSYGGGTSFTQATIEAALNAIGTVNKVTLLIRPGTWPIISNANWSAYTNVTFKGAPGATFSHGAYTMNVPNLSAGIEQIVFVGTGAITLSGYVKEAYPRWFNVAGDGTNETANLHRWLRCGVKKLVAPVPTVSYGHTGITIPASTSNLSVEGLGAAEAVLFDHTAATGDGMTFAGEADDFHLKNVKWGSTGASTGRAIFSDQLNASPFRHPVFEDVTISGFKSGILIGGSTSPKIIRGRVGGQGSAVSGGIGIRAGNDVTKAANGFVIDGTYVSSYETNIYNSYAGPLTIRDPICEGYITGFRGGSGSITLLYNPYFYSVEAGGLRDIWLEDGGYLIHTGVRGKSLGYDIDGAAPRYYEISPSKFPVRANATVSNQTITASTPTQVTLAAETYDSEGLFASNTYTASTPGYYKVKAQVQWNVLAVGTLKTHIYKNAAAIATATQRMVGMDGATFLWTQGIEDLIYLDTGDTIKLYVEQNSAGTLDVMLGATNTYLIVTGL